MAKRLEVLNTRSSVPQDLKCLWTSFYRLLVRDIIVFWKRVKPSQVYQNFEIDYCFDMIISKKKYIYFSQYKLCDKHLDLVLACVTAFRINVTTSFSCLAELKKIITRHLPHFKEPDCSLFVLAINTLQHLALLMHHLGFMLRFNKTLLNRLLQQSALCAILTND